MPLSSSDGRGLEKARLDLARFTLGIHIPLNEGVHQVAAIAAAALQVNRVSVWVFGDKRAWIRCDHLYQIDQNASAGVRLHAEDFPVYFEALTQNRVVAIADTAGDPYTVEFREIYFKPLGITAMLDAPIFREGACTGIVCHEQIGPVRQWSPTEMEFAATVADTLARLYEESARRDAETKLEALQNQVGDLERMSALGRLAAGIAHDFRNVLGTAMALVDLLEDEIGTATAGGSTAAQARLNGLHTALEQGVRLTEDLLDFGLGRKSAPRVIDLATHLEAFKPMLVLAAGPQVRCDLDLAPQGLRVFIDTRLLDRALLNIVFNARDAMPNGGRISQSLMPVQTRRGSVGETSRARIEIRDTGNGVDAETKARMFEPYFTTKASKGTGLGLALVKQVITYAGGEIEVESEPGKGLTLRLDLPRIG